MECHIHEALPIETQSRHPQRLSVAGSVLLDIVRFCAALVVAMGHFSEGPYAVRWPHLIRFAIDAVAIFFVLSGFVIRLITTISPVDARVYAVDRISRIYSVALPAVLFTFSVVLTLHILVPARSLELATYSIKTICLQLLANMTLLTQLWGMDITANFNSVFWSLCYECAYYAFYGIAFFGRGSSRNWALFLLGRVIK